MRQRQKSTGSGHRQHHRGLKNGRVPEAATTQEQTELKSASAADRPTQSGIFSTAFESYLPQAADDRTVQTHICTTLEQLEMHVENFYQQSSSSGSKMAEAEVMYFDSPHLPGPLASLLPQSKNRMALIKHCLTHFVVSSITSTSDPTVSLLPHEFAVLPSLASTSESTTGKPGKLHYPNRLCYNLNSLLTTPPAFSQTLSGWRVLTAYLRPSPSDDASYISQRDQAINDLVHTFCRAFTPWKKAQHKDETRVRSLTEILKGAADLGIWLFSQPCTFDFRWPNAEEVGRKVVVGPEVIKLTDEKGRTLGKAQQVMVKWVSQ